MFDRHVGGGSWIATSHSTPWARVKSLWLKTQAAPNFKITTEKGNRKIEQNKKLTSMTNWTGPTK
jgi:hypothetical protein